MKWLMIAAMMTMATPVLAQGYTMPGQTVPNIPGEPLSGFVTRQLNQWQTDRVVKGYDWDQQARDDQYRRDLQQMQTQIDCLNGTGFASLCPSRR